MLRLEDILANEMDLSVDALTKEYELYASPSSDKQKSILQAAEQLFAELGYDKTPTAEIAKRAGVTERTLFKHFPSKVCLWHRILSAVILRSFVPVQLMQVKRMMDKDYESYADFFRTLTRDRLKTIQANSNHLKMIIYEIQQNESFKERFGKLWYRVVWQSAVKNLERLQKEGKIRADIDIRRFARATTLMTSSYFFFAFVLMPDQKWDHEKELENMLYIIEQGVLPRSKP